MERREKAKPTKKQIDFLEGKGLSTGTITTAGFASKLISAIIQRQNEDMSTIKQIRLLEKFGFHYVGTWKFEEASSMIDKIKNNAWNLPWGVDAAKYVPKHV